MSYNQVNNLPGDLFWLSVISHGLLSLQARILITRQVLFSAVRQNVARSFIPGSVISEIADKHLLNVCRAAAYQNVELLYHLLEIVSTGNSTFGMLDYHNAFNAAIIIELGRLYGQDDSSSNFTPQLGHVLNALQSAGQSGNEFARDCSIVLADFRQLGVKLMQEMSRQTQTNTPLKGQSVQLPNNLPASAFDVPGTSAMDPTLADPSAGLELESILEEFTAWLEAGPF